MKSLDLIKKIYEIIKNKNDDNYMTNWLIFELCEKHLKEKGQLKEPEKPKNQERER